MHKVKLLKIAFIAMMHLCNSEHLCKVCVKLHLCNGEQDFCKFVVVQNLCIIAKLPLSNGARQHSCSSLPAKCTKFNLDHFKFLDQVKILVKSKGAPLTEKSAK